MKNEKYCAAVASVSWLTDAAYPLRVHTVFLRFPNFELSQKSRLGLLAKLRGVALKNCTGKRRHFRHNSKSFIHIFVDISGKVRIIQPVWLRRMIV